MQQIKSNRNALQGSTANTANIANSLESVQFGRKTGTKSWEYLPDALRNFDQLPDSANVRLPVVRALYACSSATVWRRVKAGVIPQPKKFGEKLTAWNVGELRRSLSA